MLFSAAAAALLASTPAAAAWHRANSKHFVVYADQGAAELKAYAEKLERFNSAVREARGTPDVAPGASTRVTLFLVRDIDDVQEIYGKNGDGVGGFYIPKAEGSVAFVPVRGSKNKKWGLSGENVFFHEYTHHLQLQASDRPMPAWLTEGFAEFFATPKFEPDGSVTIGAPPAYRAGAIYTIERLSLQQMLSGDYGPLSQAEYASIYGRGWLLIHLLSFDLSRRGQLTKYLDAIERGVPALKAAQDAFGDLKELDRELARYFKQKSFKVTTIPASKIAVPPVTVRPLTAAEAATIETRMLLERGGKQFRAASAAASVRNAIARHGADPSTLALLAEVELKAGRPGEALAATNQALALRPADYEALVAKGAALLEAAKAQPSKADWDAVRAPLLEANRIDREAAEPLVLFYRSYVAQGVKPTSNAMQALAYAVALTPQDTKLRLELVNQYVTDGRLKDAHEAMVTLAFEPGKGKWRDLMMSIYTAARAGDGKLAAAKIAEAEKMMDGHS
jgi:Flp pilus assembly protein TadD